MIDAAADPSAHVRQAVASAAFRLESGSGLPILEALARRDPARQVRAAALLGMLEFLPAGAQFQSIADALAAVIAEEKTPLYCAPP